MHPMCIRADAGGGPIRNRKARAGRETDAWVFNGCGAKMEIRS
ncbi:hypothetical protein C7S16_1208 [Burkholderia thailandensis]|uniref:Uncharacterized protein n=1 Tax=Burkholderia thailandensis TaxID=57975 RepID=A0AAW9CZ33_BURTH|nr:hypothetical protein [Burkholderia thailandensis]MDW9255854.1 hypothetical protein [Burkholderia thailandensis]